MESIGVITSYWVNGRPYGSYILGDSDLVVRALAFKRGLGEVVESSVQEVQVLPDFSRQPDLDEKIMQALHTCCFLSFVALKSNSMSVDEVLGDEGVIHEIVHYIEGSGKKSLSEIRDLINGLQKKAIGFYSPV